MDETRKLDVWLAEHLFGLKVVSRDWPCGEHPEEGGFQASYLADADGKGIVLFWNTLLGPVYATDEPWLETCDLTGGYQYANVEPVEFYSTTGDGMLTVISAMENKGWGWTAIRVERNSFMFYRSEIGIVDNGLWRTAATLPAAVAEAAKVALSAEHTRPTPQD